MVTDRGKQNRLSLEVRRAAETVLDGIPSLDPSVDIGGVALKISGEADLRLVSGIMVARAVAGPRSQMTGYRILADYGEDFLVPVRDSGNGQRQAMFFLERDIPLIIEAHEGK